MFDANADGCRHEARARLQRICSKAEHRIGGDAIHHLTGVHPLHISSSCCCSARTCCHVQLEAAH